MRAWLRSTVGGTPVFCWRTDPVLRSVYRRYYYYDYPFTTETTQKLFLLNLRRFDRFAVEI